MSTSETLSFASFLESVPPGSKRAFSDLFRKFPNGDWILETPEIQLHCPNDICSDVRIFESLDILGPFSALSHKDVFLTYTCRNCKKTSKTFALWVSRQMSKSGSAVKYGEMPAFGPPLPPRLSKMIGSDFRLFLKGQLAENQSLGIGAFAYYRRVVENRKDRLLTEIRKAAVRLGADQELLDKIDLARGETQFSKSLDLVKGAIPDRLKVQGQNPLTLLHRALSKGVHGLDDKECLERAQSVRVVLTELVSNMAHILKEEREVKAAVKKLQSIK